MKATRIEDRFWSKVAEEGDCWVWTAYCDPDGYGTFSVGTRKVMAHRWAYEAMVADIPDGLQIDHLCRVRCCVNPYHMEPVTPRVNTLRGDTLPARHAARATCAAGHEFTISPSGWRHCRICERARKRRTWAAARKNSAA